MKILSSNLFSLVSILNDLTYHDGNEIGSQLGISRAAVWKAIRKLKNYGIQISSIKNKGYKLEESLSLLDHSEIRNACTNYNLKVEIFETISSTNDYLKENLVVNGPNICLAEMQTAGRGRRGNLWHSPFGQNIYLSYAYKFQKDVSELSGLSLAVGISCINAIKECGIDEKIMLKWPNDVVWQGHKIIGNLIEIVSENYGDSTAIIGVGINVNMLQDSENITQNWTSLRKIAGRYIDRTQLCIALIRNLHDSLARFAAYGLQDFMQRWQELDALYDTKVKPSSSAHEGIAMGIDPRGNLLLKLANGEIETSYSGEIIMPK